MLRKPPPPIDADAPGGAKRLRGATEATALRRKAKAKGARKMSKNEALEARVAKGLVLPLPLRDLWPYEELDLIAHPPKEKDPKYIAPPPKRAPPPKTKFGRSTEEDGSKAGEGSARGAGEMGSLV